ncbi:hypothetical protein MtrunA17_Chr4g0039121 [Medicago truncatula]|uniref:Uncharacterized protein n=1 Tax=Medicago truncatula TaxID=3880 RepID=G7JQN2_MEDTR|nr:hypothetical protein MTR_4g076650 [Medicago truncatula]RHN61666.1 hypothetical protein MtrunA17_Chr4g0039121 [Medicago truncatula]
MYINVFATTFNTNINPTKAKIFDCERREGDIYLRDINAKITEEEYEPAWNNAKVVSYEDGLSLLYCLDWPNDVAQFFI